MYLLFLLVVPLAIGIAGLVIGKGRLTWKELLVMEGALIVLISGTYGIAYGVARWGAISDTEIWNGRITDKDHGTEGCCHSYPCNPYPCGCDTNGNCSTCWQTCYVHNHDEYWNATASTGDTVYSNGCNAPGSDPPARWTKIRIGEPASVEHSYDNYILANPDTILRRAGAAERVKTPIPAYPETYDHYRVKPFLAQGVHLPPQLVRDLNDRLNEINAKLGARHQVNIVVVLAADPDPMYAEALSESWVGGKKNDVVVVIGAPNYPALSWVQVVSWTKAEEMKIAIRDGIMGQKTFDGAAAMAIIEREVKSRFVRREMREFEYLLDSIEPPTWVLILIFILGIAAAVGLARYFINNDPFGDEVRRGRRREWR